MNFINKNSFITFELLFVIVIGSIIIINSFICIKDIYQMSKNERNFAIYKIDLLSSKLILKKNKEFLKNLLYKKGALYIKNSLFLNDVEGFKKIDILNLQIIRFKYKKFLHVRWVFRL